MRKSVIIAIDAMSGVNPPFTIIEGLSIFCARCSDVFFHLYGDELQLKEALKEDRYTDLRAICTIHHTNEFVLDDDQPIQAYKKYQRSSMKLSIEAVKSGLANAAVSSGNTGALMIAAKLILGMIGTIRRPAICSLVPNAKQGFVMLDMGANAECDEENLLDFAIMGTCFAKGILNRQNPNVGILNVGVESHKGRDLEKKSLKLLQGTNINCAGFVEPCDVLSGEIDVVITDGFTGNIFIKSAEATAKLCKNLISKAFLRNSFTKVIGLLSRNILKKQMGLIDPKNNNGAMFIGLNGIVVKSHGASDAIGFSSAVAKAYQLANEDVNNQICLILKQNEHLRQEQKVSLIKRLKSSLGI